MTLLVDGLLTYLHVNGLTQEMETSDLNEKFRLILYDLELMIKQENPVIEVGLLPTVKGYRRQLQPLFQNLISHALKYTKPNE